MYTTAEEYLAEALQIEAGEHPFFTDPSSLPAKAAISQLLDRAESAEVYGR